MKKIDGTRWPVAILAAMPMLLAACGGADPNDPIGTPDDGLGTDTGNSATTHRLVVGTASGDLSAGSRVLALGSTGSSLEFPIDATTGAFEAALPIGQSYVLHLASATLFDGTIYFASDRYGGKTALLRIVASSTSATTTKSNTSKSNTSKSEALTATTGDGLDPISIDFGAVACSQGACDTQHNPLETLDADHDGVTDIDDDDDDDDGVPDFAQQQSSAASAASGVALLLPVERSPGPGETGVDMDDDIRVEFNRRLDYSLLFASTSDTATWPTYIRLLDADAASVDATLRCDDDDLDGACDDDKQLRLRPASDMQACSVYTVWLSAQLVSADALTLGRDMRYSFITACEDDATRAWGIKEVRPRDGEVVESDTEEITVVFTGNVDATSVDGELRLACGNAQTTATATTVAGAWSVDGEKARFEPQDLLPLGSCTLSVGSGVRSENGDLLGTTFAVTFTVVSDTSSDVDSASD